MHAGIPHPLDQATPRTRHPPGCRACWEIRSTRGQYASYWNAILFGMIFAENYMKMKKLDREEDEHPSPLPPGSPMTVQAFNQNCCVRCRHERGQRGPCPLPPATRSCKNWLKCTCVWYHFVMSTSIIHIQ